MKSKPWATLTLTSVLLAGCGATTGNYCDVAGWVRPSTGDVLTLDTKRAMLRELEKGEAFCGLKP